MTTLTRSRLTSGIDFMAPFGTDRVNNDLVITEGGFAVPKTVVERFWKQVAIGEGCWQWQGPLNRGYGSFWYEGRSIGAHRFSYRAVFGEIPEGLSLDHLCENPPCVRPDHLEPVTTRENILRGTAPTAANARKTRCIRGHEFTAENTFWSFKGRECRTCRRMLVTRHDRKRRKTRKSTLLREQHP